MHMTTMDKDRLAAFADGEMTPEDAAAVVMHLADHPEDQAYVDDLMAANEALAKAFAMPMSEPVPPAILAAVEGRQSVALASVLPFARRPFLATGGLALAASVAVAAVLWPQTEDIRLAVGTVPGGSVLHDHLQSLPSGETIRIGAEAELTILATLPTPNGHCREVEVIDPALGRLDLVLACQQKGGWRIEVALAEALPDAVADQTYTPADGADALALTPWLDRLGAGFALDSAAEAEAIARRWQP